MSSNSIEVVNFTKTYGNFTAVDNISFTVERGSIFAFLGPNGAGKSTTISSLCTIQNPTSGTLAICGYDVCLQKDKVRSSIGIVFQESTLDAKLTIEENLKLHCDFYNVPKKEMAERIDFVLNLVDIADRRKSQVASLSGGIKRRTEIARGLIHYPEVLFLDEPTTGLDPQSRANVWNYIRKLQKQKNITIFLTTHYMDEAEICNKVAIIDHGKIVAYDTPHNLKRLHTSTTMKLTVRTPEEVSRHLDLNAIAYSFVNGEFKIRVNDLDRILEIATLFRAEIDDIEINKGTLNDVFLAITGKEIRA